MLKNEVEDTSLRAVFASKYYPNSYSPVIKPLGTWIANYMNTNNNFQIFGILQMLIIIIFHIQVSKFPLKTKYSFIRNNF